MHQRASSRTRNHRSERGAILILTSISMVAMMCFAGLAIDMGVVRAERAQYQATADAAALYATYLIRQPGADVQTVATKVRAFVASNLGIDGGATDAAWGNCADAKKLTTVSAQDASINNNCISFLIQAGDSQARVRLPMREIKPVIGLGLAAMEVTAVAGAEGSGAGCDAFSVAGCSTTTTMAPTTVAPTTTRAPSPTTTRATGPTTTRPPSPTTTKAPSPTTTKATGPTTTKAPSPTTTKAPTPTTTKPTTTTTTRPPVPTTLDIGF